MAITRDVVETEIAGDRVQASLASPTQAEERPTLAVVCIHGLAAQRRAVDRLLAPLAEAGFTALAPDLRGHGASQGERGRISQDRAIEDLQAWAAWLAEHHDAQVCALVGHSLGGFWAMAAHEQLDVDAIAMVATPASIRGELTLIERAAYRIVQAVDRALAPAGIDLPVPYQVSLEETLSSEAARQRAREIALVQRSLPAANAGDLLRLDGPAMAREVTVPAIVAHPEDDQLVPEASTRELYEALPEPKTWLGLAGPHECFFETGGDQQARRLVETLSDVLANDGPGSPHTQEAASRPTGQPDDQAPGQATHQEAGQAGGEGTGTTDQAEGSP